MVDYAYERWCVWVYTWIYICLWVDVFERTREIENHCHLCKHLGTNSNRARLDLTELDSIHNLGKSENVYFIRYYIGDCYSIILILTIYLKAVLICDYKSDFVICQCFLVSYGRNHNQLLSGLIWLSFVSRTDHYQLPFTSVLLFILYLNTVIHNLPDKYQLCTWEISYIYQRNIYYLSEKHYPLFTWEISYIIYMRNIIHFLPKH